MKKKSFNFIVKGFQSLTIAALLLVSCENNPIDSEQADTKALMDGAVNLLDPGRYGCAEFSKEYLNSIDFLTPAEYTSKISTLRPDLASKAKTNFSTLAVPSSFNLPSQPVGDQGNEGSCVGWGVGYAAHGITRYINNTVHANNWSGASRSAAYVYNQIKISNCGSGSFPNDAMNLIKNQGQCSNIQMPYVNGGCYTMPTAQQRSWAADRKSNGWFNINVTNVADIKYYLSQNYPVAACFDVNSSFYNIKNNNYVWSTLSGKREGGHCVCIVGYNDTTRQFKVQNSWGPTWGRSGYFYVTYDNVARGAFVWMAGILPNVASNNPQ